MNPVIAGIARYISKYSDCKYRHHSLSINFGLGTSSTPPFLLGWCVQSWYWPVDPKLIVKDDKINVEVVVFTATSTFTTGT